MKYVGYQGNKPVIVAETKETLNSMLLIHFDKIETCPDCTEVINGKVLFSADDVKMEKASELRNIRNCFLQKYVDPYQALLRWKDLNEDERNKIIKYRKYLLDLPQSENFPENEVTPLNEF